MTKSYVRKRSLLVAPATNFGRVGTLAMEGICIAMRSVISQQLKR